MADLKNIQLGTDSFDIVGGVELEDIINLIYPVGSIYISVNNVNPSTFLQDTTWVSWGNGKCPVGVNASETEFDAVEKIGGEKTHTLTENEMPTHYHIYTDSYLNGNPQWLSTNSSNVLLQTTGVTVSKGTHPKGDGDPHNNLQPYITCYMWKRTA